jgi:hypothetical protein
VDGTPRVRVYRGLASGGFSRRYCPRAHVSWRPAAHLVRAWVPKRCMVGPGELFMQSWSTTKGSRRAADLTRVRNVARD